MVYVCFYAPQATVDASTYKIAESYRDARTGQVRHIASLGRVDRLLEDDGLKISIDGL